MPAKICTHPWSFHVAPFRIFGNLYYVGNKGVSSHLVDTGEGLLLFDTTFPQTFYMVLDAIYQLGFSPRDLRYVFHSHAHYDHIGGSRALRDLTDAVYCLGKDDVELVGARTELTETDLYGQEFYEQVEIGHPLEDGETINLGNTTVTAIHCPGHTPGTMSYVIGIPDGDRTLTAALHGGPGLATLTDDYLARFDLPLSLRQAYRDHLDKLRAIDVDIHLSIHPSQSQTLGRMKLLADDPRAFIDRSRWPVYLDSLESMWQKQFIDK